VLGAIPMVACLMPSVCVMICGGPGARPASLPAWATPLMGGARMHASNRPVGWPAAEMGRHGLLPWGLALSALARPTIVPEYPTGMRSTVKMAPLEESRSYVFPPFVARDFCPSSDLPRTGSEDAKIYKWGSTDAPHRAGPAHGKHGPHLERVHESAAAHHKPCSTAHGPGDFTALFRS